MRPHPAHAYHGIKAAVRIAVGYVGGIDAAASITRVGRTLIGAYQDLASDRFIPADVILDIEAIAGGPHITAALARAQGYELLALAHHGPADVAVMMAGIGTEASRAFTTLAEALGDGLLSDKERYRLAGDLDALIGAARRARSALAVPQEDPA